MGLLTDGRKSFKIGLAVLIQYRHMTDSQPAAQPRRHSKYALCISASRSHIQTTFYVMSSLHCTTHDFVHTTPDGRHKNSTGGSIMWQMFDMRVTSAIVTVLQRRIKCRLCNDEAAVLSRGRS